MQTKIVERYFFFGLLLATLIFTFLIFRPFWIVLILGICFSIVLYPIYEWLKKRSPSWVASLLTVILFTILVCGPLLGIGVIIFNQSQDLYQSATNAGNSAPFLDSLGHTINGVLPSGVDFNIQTKASEFISYLTNNIANIFSATLSAFFSFVLMLLIMFYFLKDGAEWKKTLVALSPLGDMDDEKIISRLSHSVNAVIKGSLLIALIQGVLFSVFQMQHSGEWSLVFALSCLPSVPPLYQCQLLYSYSQQDTPRQPLV
jgi:predicted PurR-regulated permease PerM